MEQEIYLCEKCHTFINLSDIDINYDDDNSELVSVDSKPNGMGSSSIMDDYGDSSCPKCKATILIERRRESADWEPEDRDIFEEIAPAEHGSGLISLDQFIEDQWDNFVSLNSRTKISIIESILDSLDSTSINELYPILDKQKEKIKKYEKEHNLNQMDF